MGCSNCKGKKPPPQHYATPPERRTVKKWRENLLTAKIFNEMYLVGNRFRYYSVRGDD